MTSELSCRRDEDQQAGKHSILLKIAAFTTDLTVSLIVFYYLSNVILQYEVI